jgi:hypothetical protein
MFTIHPPPIDFEQIDQRNFLLIFAYKNQNPGGEISRIKFIREVFVMRDFVLCESSFCAIILRSDWIQFLLPPSPDLFSLAVVNIRCGEHSPLDPPGQKCLPRVVGAWSEWSENF